MKLNKEVIKGTIKEINWDRVAAIGLTIGLISVSGTMVKMNMEKKNISLDYHGSYSKQLEAVYDKDIDDDKEPIIDKLGELLDMANSATTDEEKGLVANQFNEEKEEVKDSILDLIKMDYAKEDGREASDYTIRKEDKQEGNGWEIYRNVDGIGTDVHKLTFGENTVVNFADSLESSKYDGSKDSAEKLVDEYEAAIKKAADHVVKISDKAK